MWRIGKLKASPLYEYITNELTNTIVALYEKRDTLSERERVELETKKEVLTKINEICSNRGRY